MYVIKVCGDKVRMCATDDEVVRALKFIKGGVVYALKDCGRLPRAEKGEGLRFNIYHENVTIKTRYV